MEHPLEMIEDGEEHHERGAYREDEEKDEDPVALQQGETQRERWKTREDALFVILQRSGLSSETLSALAKQRDSFGMAWLAAWLYKKNRTRGKVFVNPPRAIDLSETHGVSPEKIFLFMRFLPPSIEEIKLDSVAVKGKALPLLQRFLGGGQTGKEEAWQPEGPHDILCSFLTYWLLNCFLAFVFRECLGGKETWMYSYLLWNLVVLCLFGPAPFPPVYAVPSEVFSFVSQCTRGFSLLSFLQGCMIWSGPGGTREDREREGPTLKKFTFAENSIGPEEAPAVIPLLLPNLEGLCLKGNSVGVEGFRALAVGVRDGKAPFLRFLDLENTGLKTFGLPDEGLVSLCCRALLRLAVGEKGVGLETLNVSGNSPMIFWELRDVVSAGFLPRIRVLQLSRCELYEFHLGFMKNLLCGGFFRNLETLDLGGNRGKENQPLGSFVSFLRLDMVPRLKNLNLMTLEGWSDCGFASFFGDYLMSANCPPLENVHIHIRSLREEHLCGLAGGQYPAVRVLRLELDQHQLALFLRELSGSFEALELDLRLSVTQAETETANDGLRLMGSALEAGRLHFLRRLSVFGSLGYFGQDTLAEGKSALLNGLQAHKFSNLCELELDKLALSADELAPLGEAVRVGNLSALRVFSLRRNYLLGQVGVEELMQRVVESEKGFPLLEQIDTSFTQAGDWAGSVGRVLRSGKLPRLSEIRLACSRLTSEGVRGLADAVRAGDLVNFSAIDLNFNDQLVEREAWVEFIHAISDSETGLPKLKLLNIQNTGILDDEGGIDEGGMFVSALGSGNMPSLECLGHFSEVRLRLDAIGIQSLGEAVRGGKFPPRLGKIEVATNICNINVDSLFLAIAESEAGLPDCITALHLEGGRLGEGALGCLAAASGTTGSGKLRLPRLERLNLCRCGVDDSCVKMLGQVFSVQKCPHLKALDLGENMISLEGFSAFIDSLQTDSLPKLTELSVGNQEGIEGEEERRSFDAAVRGLKIRAQSKGKLRSCEVPSL